MNTEERIFVGGEWRAGRGRSLTDVNPANGAVIARFNTASPEDVSDAVEAGRAAMAAPQWRDMKPHLRARGLHRIADVVDRDGDAISA